MAAPEMGESSDQMQAANDQEMGLAVAILELIGSRPHITVTNPSESETNPQEEFVNVPVNVPFKGNLCFFHQIKN